MIRGVSIGSHFEFRRLFTLAPSPPWNPLYTARVGPPPTFAMGFKVPECVDTDAWGPPVDSVDADAALTYAPFTRSDKFGRGA